MNNNKGLSLVELIVVIAILSVLSGVIFVSIGSISKFQVKETSNTLVANLNKARTAAMSKKDNEVVISYHQDKDCYYIKLPGSTEQVKIAEKGIQIYYYAESDNQTESIGPTLIEESLNLSFNRSSGSFNPLLENNKLYVNKLTVVKGSHSRDVSIIPPTGKVSLK